MQSFQGAIFDLDGTLLDSMWIWEQIDIEFLGRRGLPVPDDYLEKITPMHFYQAAEYTIGRFGLSETPDDLIAEWSDMALDAYRNRIGLKPYAKEYLLFLKEKGVETLHCNRVEQRNLHAGARAQWYLRPVRRLHHLGRVAAREGLPRRVRACGKKGRPDSKGLCRV